jgi:adenylosuccinate synthase
VPVFEQLPDWSEDISEVATFAALPANCKHYVARISELVEALFALSA